VKLLTTHHREDQRSALKWLQKQTYVEKQRIALAGNSFGGILSLLGASDGKYCAAINGAGGAQSWSKSPGIRSLMRAAVLKSKAPIFFFQAENDSGGEATRVLSELSRKMGRTHLDEARIYPAFGASVNDGHKLPYLGQSVWAPDTFHFLRRHCGEKLGNRDESLSTGTTPVRTEKF
jgi:dienelactone hydrolase